MNAEAVLSVIVPCYNEQDTIAELVDQVLARPEVAEVIIVDDGSTDGTRDILAGFDDPRIRVLLQPVNLGKGAALQRGFMRATADFVVVQDADLEYDPSEYPILLEPLLAGKADVVYGSRFLSAKSRRVLYFWHSIGNKMLTLMSNVFTDLNLTDMETCYKVFRREVIQSIELTEDRFGIEPEVTAKVAAGKWRVWEVGISYNGRTYAEGKKIGLRDAFRAAFVVLRHSPPASRLARSRSFRAKETKQATSELSDSLSHLAEAESYAEYLVDALEPHLDGVVHEIGAGVGTIAKRVAERGWTVVASEPDEHEYSSLVDSLADHEATALQADLDQATAQVTADTVVMCNVLEHIEDDRAALAKIYDSLNPGGRLVVLVPAHDMLYGPFDLAVGHYRRYRRTDLINRLADAGFDLDQARHMNRPGALIWFGWARLLRQNPAAKSVSSAFDRFMTPLVRATDEYEDVPFGLSVLAVGRKPESSEAS